MAKRQLRGAALTAKMIKQRLTALYPRVKFSVTSDTFSMGDSVDIKWTDGPRREDVETITKRYQYGSFDGMTDSYNYTRIDSSLGCDGAKYVHCSRNISPERMVMLEVKLKELYGEMDSNDHGYYHRLAEVEKEFFPYLETQNNRQAQSVASGLEYDIFKDVDTRDNSEIYVVKVITRVDDFSALRADMKSLGGYYSRFKRGFIFREDPTAILTGGIDGAGKDSSGNINIGQGEERIA